MYTIFYTQGARRDLDGVDFSVSQRIVQKIFFYSRQKNPLSFAKRLHDARFGHYRFRIGDYRAIFDVEKTGMIHVLMILRIKHRKDVYGF